MGLAEKSKRGGLRVKLSRSHIIQVVTTRSEVPDWGRLPNKRFSDFVRMAKLEKYASVATLALLAVSALANIGTLYNKCVFMAMLRCEK